VFTPKLNNKLPHNGSRQLERHVVLVAPQIHWNAGNIGRTCLATGAFLHLVRPLGFSLESREVKRAGLDYWQKVELAVWDDFSEFLAEMMPRKSELAMFSKRGANPFSSSDRKPVVFPTKFCANLQISPTTFPLHLKSGH
jgi:tRNA (cytidine/uridine-2'-O-)-methyltransferase